MGRLVRATSTPVAPAATNNVVVERSTYLHPQQHSYHAPVLHPNTYTLNLVGTVGLALVIGVIIYDFIAYLFAVYRNATDSYSPYGRRLISIASDVFTNKHVMDEVSPYLQGRSLEPIGNILDALSKAAEMWGDEVVTPTNRKPKSKSTDEHVKPTSRQSKIKSADIWVEEPNKTKQTYSKPGDIIFQNS